MDCFIKKIFQGNVDEKVHSQFIRFGKGDYPGRAIIKLHKSKKVKLKGSYEYANDFVLLASELGGGEVSGIILSKKDLSQVMSENNIIGNSESKKKGLFYKNNIDSQELSSEQINLLVENSYFCLIDVVGSDFSLKIKKSLPKPGKAGAKKIDDKFCQLEADLKDFLKIKEGFFWDVSDFKKAEAIHEYIIDEIVLPNGENDPEKMRLLAKRKGKIVRSLIIDKFEKTAENELIV